MQKVAVCIAQLDISFCGYSAMLKSILVKTLVDYFGEYVEGLNAENLKLGVWSERCICGTCGSRRRCVSG